MIDLLIEDPGSSSGWLSLERPDKSLYLHADTFASSQMTLKKVTASNAYIPGTYVVRATPDNTTETIAVYVSDTNDATREQKADYLIGLFTRVNYQLMKVLSTHSVLMTGQAADYQINNQREFLHSGLTLITFSVPVLPTKRLVAS